MTILSTMFYWICVKEFSLFINNPDELVPKGFIDNDRCFGLTVIGFYENSADARSLNYVCKHNTTAEGYLDTMR